MLVLFLLLAVTAAAVVDVDVTEPACPSCVLMNTTCYNISYLFDLNAPFRKQVVIHRMGILRSQNKLFFSFEPTIEDVEYYKTGFVSLDDPSQAGVISGSQIFNFGAFDIDQDNDLVYFGGDGGIFILNANSNSIAAYSSLGDTVTNLYYKNHVYFVRYNDRGIIEKVGDNFRTLMENFPIRKFVVTKKDNVVIFSSTLGLFVGKGENVHRISKNGYFRGITIDLDGNVYAWWIDGIYKVVLMKNLQHSKLVRVAKIPFIGAMTFDNDNRILFTSDKSLYLMEPTANSCGVVKVIEDRA